MVCPLELKREFDQLDLTEEGRNECVWNSPQGKHTVEANALYMAFELAEKNWKLSLGDRARSPSRYTVAAGHTAALLECIARIPVRWGYPGRAATLINPASRRSR